MVFAFSLVMLLWLLLVLLLLMLLLLLLSSSSLLLLLSLLFCFVTSSFFPSALASINHFVTSYLIIFTCLVWQKSYMVLKQLSLGASQSPEPLRARSRHCL
jgi:hypothetical protein